MFLIIIIFGFKKGETLNYHKKTITITVGTLQECRYTKVMIVFTFGKERSNIRKRVYFLIHKNLGFLQILILEHNLVREKGCFFKMEKADKSPLAD